MICYVIGLLLNIALPLHVSARSSFIFFCPFFLTLTQKIKYSLSERYFFCFVLFCCFFLNLLTTDVFTP